MRDALARFIGRRRGGGAADAVDRIPRKVTWLMRCWLLAYGVLGIAAGHVLLMEVHKGIHVPFWQWMAVPLWIGSTTGAIIALGLFWQPWVPRVTHFHMHVGTPPE